MTAATRSHTDRARSFDESSIANLCGWALVLLAVLLGLFLTDGPGSEDTFWIGFRHLYLLP